MWGIFEKLLFKIVTSKVAVLYFGLSAIFTTIEFCFFIENYNLWFFKLIFYLLASPIIYFSVFCDYFGLHFVDVLRGSKSSNITSTLINTTIIDSSIETTKQDITTSFFSKIFS